MVVDSKSAKMSKIVVVGAGVSGLTTALLLSQNPAYRITVIAKHQPGDMHIEYASPWAGANYIPVSLAGSHEEEFERNTWSWLENLAKTVPESGIHLVGSHEYFAPKVDDAVDSPALQKWRSEIEKPNPWFKEVLPDWRSLSDSECPGPYPRGVSFTSVCINPQIYLPYLQSRLIKAGVTFRRAGISHITEAGDYFISSQRDTMAPHVKTEKADIVVNCTGLSSLNLGGVEDKKVYPIRGQIVLVQEEVDYMISCADMDTDTAAVDEFCYTMSRGGGGGSVLGGCYQIGNWDGKINEDMTERILKRAVKYIPSLLPASKKTGSDDDWKKLTIVRQGVGLRPAREGGVRIEKELVKHDDWQGWVVHNYGHGGYGYQSSWGCAMAVAKLVNDCVASPAS